MAVYGHVKHIAAEVGPAPAGRYRMLHNDEFARTSAVSPAWKNLCHLGNIVRYPKNSVVFRAGDTVDALYYVLKGEVRMESLHMDGAEKTYWYIGEGCVFGETPLFHRIPSRLTVVFLCPGEVCVFSRKVLLGQIFAQYPEITEDMFRNMACKIRVLTNQIATLSMDGLAVRICKYLQLHLSRDETGKLISRPRINQQGLANLLGVHRVTCNRVLRNLERGGIISEFCRETVYILDEEAFQRRLEGFSEDG